MPFSRLLNFIFSNAKRNKKQFLISAFGVVIGIAAFVFFLALSAGVQNILLGDMFPIDQVEVIAPRASFLGVDMTKKLTADTVEEIKARPDVEWVVPRMGLAFPSAGKGWFDGNEIKFELVGDGIDPDFAEDRHKEVFKDWEASEKSGDLAVCGPAPRYACDGLYYCDERDMRCHHRVPVLVSRHLIGIYNSQFAQSRGMPTIGGFEEFIADRGGLSKMRLYIDLGRTMTASNKSLKSAPRRVEGVILGLSDRAIRIGVTVPIQYVERWNREYVGDEAAAQYSSLIVKLKDKDDVGSFGSWVESEMDLRLADSVGEMLGKVILAVTLLLLLVSFIIVFVSATNIAHNFFMQVAERKKEIGLLRAIGATQRDIWQIILGEAALIGIFAGAFGLLVAWILGKVVDVAVAQYVPNNPFKTDTFFDFQPWILAMGMGFAVAFCIIGGILPARRAAKLAPAQALAAR